MMLLAPRRIAGAALAVVVVAGCVSPAGSPTGTVAGSPSTATTASPSPTTAAVASSEPSAPATSQPSVEPTVVPSEAPPTEVPVDPSCPNANDDTISVQEYVDAPTSCFRLGVRVRGWLDTPPALGFEPPLVKPSWIFYPSDSGASLWHQPPPEPDHVCVPGEDCWWFFPHIDPDFDLTFAPLQRWVILTGHTRDPRAANCHYDGEGPNPNPELVVICGRQLVVTAIEEAP